MQHMIITTRVPLPEDYFEGATAAHLVGESFKAFFNQLEKDFPEASFTVTTEDGGLVKATVEPRKKRGRPAGSTNGAAPEQQTASEPVLG